MIERERIRREEFPVCERMIYLNHAAVSPWPQRCAAAIRAFCDDNIHNAARHYPAWLETEQRLRARACRLLGAPAADDIALVKNTSEGLSMVAHGLDYPQGANVVVPREEFPSNRVVWQSLARYGVEIRLVEVGRGESLEERLQDSCDRHTFLLAVSSVQYASGYRADLERLGTFCRRNGILLCVDAIQSLGALPFDVTACHADFVVADAHKWMMGPEGLALFYSSPALRERMQLHEYGWHMLENSQDYTALEWQPAASARRFECGSPNMLAIHGLEKSLDLILELGVEEIAAAITANTALLIESLADINGIELRTSEDAATWSGIVAFAHRSLPSERLYRQLAAHDIIASVRDGAVRLSPHFYNNRDDLEKTVAVIAEVIRHAASDS